MRRRTQRDTGGTPAFQRWLGSPLGTATAAKVATAVVWCLVACGPLALLTTTFPHARPVNPAVSSQTPGTGAGTGPGGFAQLYVAAYLRSGGNDVGAFFSGTPDLSGQPGSWQVTTTTVVAMTEVSRGYWCIVVAATGSTADAPRYFQVPVQAAGGNTNPSYTATALPAEVTGPGQAAASQLGYNTGLSIPPGSLTAAVSQFLTAYLTGSGNLSRYLSPGTTLTPVKPAPYSSIQAVTVYPQDGTSPDAAGPPADGARLRVLAQVQAADAGGGQWPLTYALTLTAVASQWDVAALDPAPALAASPAKGR